MLITSVTNGASSSATNITQQTTSSFSDILAATQDTEKTAASVEVISKPSMAQFMAMTGCDTQTAVGALYRYNNWNTYMEDQESISLEKAQAQLQGEVDSGERTIQEGSYGQRADYVEPIFAEPTIPGTLVPLFNDVTGELQGVGLIGQDGTKYTTAAINDKETIERHVQGFGLGQKTLDSFAKLVGGANCTWATLNTTSPQQDILNAQTFSITYPNFTSW